MTSQMCVTALKKSAKYVGLTEQNFNFRVRPIIGRYVLHKTKELIECHLLQLTAELAHERRADVDVKVFGTDH